MEHMKDPRPQLIQEIARFCKRTGMAESRLGRNVNNTPSLVQRIRDGDNVSIDSLLAVDSFIKNYRKPK